MGLGKTLQIITLVHTLFRYPEIGIKTVLIITPHSTIENWCKEFQKWLKDIPEEKNFLVFNLSESKTYESRNNLVQEWQRESGVLVTSYQSYRTIVKFKGIDKFPTLLETLVDPGPNLIICDEGHLLKNHNSAISKAVNRIKTLRRIVLTGTPLQNNLKEYHCMVDFIRPNLLGSLKDFTNRFINPITNGQYSDSTPLDVKLMKRRSHVLHRMLEGFVQRCDYTVLTPFLPPKHEYVIYLKMSSKQIELYKYYLDKYRQSELFANYHMLQMIWTHPKLLAIYSKQVEKKKQKLKDMESTSSDNTSDVDSHSSSIEQIENVDYNWWKELVTKKDLESVYPYSKFIMMFSLLQECEEIGDKVLIFSQSLNTLDLIQHFLENAELISSDMGGPYGKSWYQGEDFFRIDGSVNLKDREECCDQFNDVTNLKYFCLHSFKYSINVLYYFDVINYSGCVFCCYLQRLST
uniref:Transcriptional regulator ATRX n=1 Tax=Sipha flava TaxID=143950 RepID=A0A2S2Q290_9HEMI